MKAVMIHGPGDVRVDEIENPKPGPDDIVVRIKACGICGSDVGYAAVGGIQGPSDTPTPLGHEFSGIIESVGSDVRDMRPGQRVIIDPSNDINMIGSGGAGALAPFILVKQVHAQPMVYPIPDALPHEKAALTEPLSVSLHGVNRSGAKAGDKVVVFGAGCIGLGVVLFLKKRGVGDLVVIDKSKGRLERAKALGADLALHPDECDIWAEIGRRHGSGSLFGFPYVGSDVYLEVSGAPGVIPAIIDHARFNAHLTVIAVHHAPVQVNFLTALAKEMSFNTSMAYPTEFPEVLGMLSRGELNTEPLVSHSYGFDQFPAAFETAKDKERSAKVMVTFT